MANERQEHPDYGVVIFNVLIKFDGKPHCVPLHAMFKSEQKQLMHVMMNTHPFEFWKNKANGAIMTLPPGTWTFLKVACYKEDFYGPIAQIKIAPGEIVNAGRVVADRVTLDPGDLWTQPKYTTRVTIEELPPETIESLKKRAPETFARAKRRNFAVNAGMR